MAKLRFKMFKEDNLRVMRLMLERVKLWEQGLSILLERQTSTRFFADRLEEIEDCDDLQLQTTSDFKADHMLMHYDSDCDDEAMWILSTENNIIVEKKLFVIEQPIFPAPPADSTAQVFAQWNAVFDAHNEELKSIFGKQAGVKRFDLIQTFHACKQEEGKLVGPYVIKMKNYMAQWERLGYVLPQDLNVGLIMASLVTLMDL
ncbi:hypothetical protein Tco_0289434 [Tanacetum coccineum]